MILKKYSKLFKNLSLPIKKYRIKGQSMYPIINSGDQVIISSYHYLIKSPKIGDIVACLMPQDNRVIVKRISEIKSGRYFVLGDNYSNSTDSRQFGWLSKKSLLGKVICVL